MVPRNKNLKHEKQIFVEYAEKYLRMRKSASQYYSDVKTV